MSCKNLQNNFYHNFTDEKTDIQLGLNDVCFIQLSQQIFRISIIDQRVQANSPTMPGK